MPAIGCGPSSTETRHRRERRRRSCVGRSTARRNRSARIECSRISDRRCVAPEPVGACAVGATAALLLAGGGAGVLALTSAPVSPTVRTTSLRRRERRESCPTLPPVSEPRVRVGRRHARSSRLRPTIRSCADPDRTAGSGTSETRNQPELPSPSRTTGAGAPPGHAAVRRRRRPRCRPRLPHPNRQRPRQPPAASTSQVLSSTCGDVVVEIDGGTVRITSIAPLPGYTSQVSTDGPESVEMKFLGTDDGCEVHAELEASGLDVEIQNSEPRRLTIRRHGTVPVGAGRSVTQRRCWPVPQRALVPAGRVPASPCVPRGSTRWSGTSRC